MVQSNYVIAIVVVILVVLALALGFCCHRTLRRVTPTPPEPPEPEEGGPHPNDQLVFGVDKRKGATQ
jgi:hypothetical protein